MKELPVSLGKWIFGFFRERCNSQDYLLNQNWQPISRSTPLEIDRPAEEVVISLLNSGLGPSNYKLN